MRKGNVVNVNLLSSLRTMDIAAVGVNSIVAPTGMRMWWAFQAYI
ncbi:hypothetical protein [Enterocloster bolteae]